VSVLVDTNVLLRRTQPGHSQYNAAVESVARLLAGGEPMHYTLQNVAEFWHVLTRPAANNGLGLSVVRAEAEIVGIEETLTLLPDVPAIYAAANVTSWSMRLGSC
jgi:predicted nucleic acid-binding protein